MKKATLQLETLSCPSCMAKIEGAVKNIHGVEKDTIKVLFNASKLKLDFDEEKTSIDDIEKAINKVGYEVESAKEK